MVCIASPVRERARGSTVRELSDYVNEIRNGCECRSSDTLQVKYLKTLDEYAVRIGNSLLGSPGSGKRKLWTTRLRETKEVLDELENFVKHFGTYVDPREFNEKMQQVYQVVDLASSGSYVKRNYSMILDSFKGSFDSSMQEIIGVGKIRGTEQKAVQRAGIEHILDWHPYCAIPIWQVPTKPLTTEQLRSNLYFSQGDIVEEQKEGLFSRIKRGVSQRAKKVSRAARDFFDYTPLPKLNPQNI